MTLSEYAANNIGELIDQVAKGSAQAAGDASEECIHDLRVSIRRLSETLRVFEDVCPGDAAAKVRKDLKEAMQLAGEIRNHDIALDLAEKAKVKVAEGFAGKREAAAAKLRDLLGQWNSSSIFETWRGQLHA